MGIESLKKIANNFEKKRNSIFKYPIEKQKKYIEHFPEPKDGIERSYFQYCCQMKLYGEIVHLLLNLIALPLSLYYLIKLRVNNVEKKEKADAIFFNDGKPFNIIPNSVLKEYKKILTITNEKRNLLKEDKTFLKKIFKRYPFSYFFWLKLLLKVSQYSYSISIYNPKAVISCNEFSFTAPILTEYCHFRGAKLINVMHGEKMYFMRDSFSKYDAFYVWSKEHLNLLTSLRAYKKQFKIELPESLKIDYKSSTNKSYDFIYYIGNETETELIRIKTNLEELQQRGFKVAVRPHPRYSDSVKIKQIFRLIEVEDTKKITIEESLMQTKNAISLYSTVLTQAYYGKIGVIIDDISSVERYKKLKELNYTMFSAKHKLLSELLDKKQ